MATTDALKTQILHSAEILAHDISDPKTSLTAVSKYAAAVRDLAEAWAWLERPGQPHGGSASTEAE
jgi:hypothetical protein